jgi:hypothetical protein
VRAAAALLAIALAAGPRGALAQGVTLGAAPDAGAVVLGRVCLDRDGDGRCGPGDPGVAGARVLSSAGAVAVAGPGGRFHLLGVPGRVLAREALAYGGLSLAVEGLEARRVIEVAPDGAAGAELFAPAPPPAEALDVTPAPEETPAPDRDGAGLRWGLALRVPPDARVIVEGAALSPGAGGLVVLHAALAPGENAVAFAVQRGDAWTVWRWPVHLAPREGGGALVLPRAPERRGQLRVFPARGGGALVVGSAAPDADVSADGLAPERTGDGAFAAWMAAGAELRVDGMSLPAATAAARGLAAATGVVELEVSAGGGDVIGTARGSGAARGRVAGLQVEAGVDLDDRDRVADLLRARENLVAEHAPDPARTFLGAGDGAAAGDRNPDRGRVWARVDGEGVSARAGAVRGTLRGGAELGRYDRALHGASADVARDAGPLRVSASAFGGSMREDARGNGPASAAHDVLAGTGGAVYWLSHGEVVPGSEALRVEWRDPFTGRPVRIRALVRGEHYAISWSDGRITLANPLASAGAPAALVTGDPFEAARAVLVVDYLHAAPAGATDVAGGAVRAALGAVAVGAAAARDDRPGDRWELGTAFAAVGLGRLELRADGARSRGLLFGAGGFAGSTDGGLTAAPPAAQGGADALHLEARAAAGPVRVEGWWRLREAGYSDAEFLEPRRAREDGARLEARGEALHALVLLAERVGTDPADPSGATPFDERRALARAGWRAGGWAFDAEVLHARADAPEPGEATSAGVRVERTVAPGVAVEASHHQALARGGAARDPTFTGAGVRLEARGAALAVRGGWGPELGPRLLVSGERARAGEAVYGTFSVDPDAPSAFRRDAGGAVGARQVAGPAELFVEDQVARDAFGLRAARVVGARVAPGRGLTLSLSGERGQRQRPGGDVVDRSAAAASAAVVRGAVRASVRGEVRDEGGEASWAAGASAEWQVSVPLTLFARGSFARGTAGAVDALGLDASAGVAFRADGGSALATASRLAEQRPGAERRDGTLLRLAATARGPWRTEWGAGGGVAWWRSAGGDDDRIAASVRVRVPIAGPLDAAAEYARRGPLSGDLGALDAVRAEVGVAAGPARLAVGYTVVGFGGDGLDPAEETQRVHLRIQLAR